MPGRFVKSQLFRMPGDERKFRRRRIVASLPMCKRAREVAVSQTSASDGAPGTGVAVVSRAGDIVGERRGARVSVGKMVGGGVFVIVVEGMGPAASTGVPVTKVA